MDFMESMHVFKVGESFTLQKKITEKDTALNYGSGKLENLFATPSLVGMMIEASSRLLDEQLEEGFITIGRKVMVEHNKPSVLGETVSVKVVVNDVEGANISIEMIAYDEVGEIGRGHHERVVVNKKALLNKANKREEKLHPYE